MEALYGPSDGDVKSTPTVLASHRIQCNVKAKEKLKARSSQLMEDLLTFPSPPEDEIPEPQKRRHNTRRTVKKHTRTHVKDNGN